MPIRLRQDQLDDIHAQARAAYPCESCGLLAGVYQNDGIITVTGVVHSPNIAQVDAAKTRTDRFEVDPQIRFDLMRALRNSDEEIVGHYHSHPDHAPEPSETDMDCAFEPDLIWLITSVTQNGADDANDAECETTAWRLNRDLRTSERIAIKISK